MGGLWGLSAVSLCIDKHQAGEELSALGLWDGEAGGEVNTSLDTRSVAPEASWSLLTSQSVDAV